MFDLSWNSKRKQFPTIVMTPYQNNTLPPVEIVFQQFCVDHFHPFPGVGFGNGEVLYALHYQVTKMSIKSSFNPKYLGQRFFWKGTCQIISYNGSSIPKNSVNNVVQSIKFRKEQRAANAIAVQQRSNK